MKKKKLFAVFVVFMFFLLTACEQKKCPEKPELMQPVSNTEEFRPVFYYDMSDMKVYFGVVCPEEECYFFKTPTTLKEICVKEGDYVKEGDILAVADETVVSGELDKLLRELDYKEQQWALLESKSKLERKKLELEIAQTDEKDKLLLSELKTKLSVFDENNIYDSELITKERENLNNEIAGKRSLLDDANIVARKSGYVSFCYDISQGNLVDETKNLVVVMDEHNSFIRVDNRDADSSPFAEDAEVFAKYGEEIIALNEYKYSNEEMFVANVKQIHLPLRLKFSENNSYFEVGDTVPVFVREPSKGKVLVVGKDSVYTDEAGEYCYVKNDNELEKRYIECREQGDEYAVVFSGLEEGEKVLYSLEDRLPIDYKEYVVENADFAVKKQLKEKSLELVDKSVYEQVAECKGRIDELFIEKNQEVSKGDILMRVTTNEGEAELYEVGKQIEDRKLRWNKITSDYEGDKKALENNLKMQAKESYEYNQLLCDIELAKVDYDLAYIDYEKALYELNELYETLGENNDGQGRYLVRASEDGVVTKVKVKSGDYYISGNAICTLEKQHEKELYINEPNVFFNQSIYFKNQDDVSCGKIMDSEYQGYYSILDEDKTYFTTNNSNGKSRIKVEESVLDSVSDYTCFYERHNIKNTLVVPKEYVTKQKVANNEYCYYVFRKLNGEIFKQYINVYEESGSCDKYDECYCVLSGLDKGDVVVMEEK